MTRPHSDPIRAVLFDAVGTLFRPRGSIGEIYSDVAAAHGLSVPARELEDRFRKHALGSPDAVDRGEWRELVGQIFRDLGEFADFERFFAELYETFRSTERWRLFPDSLPVLDGLSRAGLPLGLVTNFDERIHGILRGLGIASFFERVETPGSSGFRKPDPRIFLCAAREMGLPPSSIAAVGDDPVQDLEASRRAGMRGFLVDRRVNGPEAASFVLPDLTPLLTLVDPAGSGASPP